jgi:KDO2-lipid IV(A) lauroyltransferase
MRAIIWLLTVLPLDMASALGGLIGRTVLRFSHRGRLRHAPETIRIAFPGASDREVDRIVSGMLVNIGRILGELAHLNEFRGPDNPRLRFVGREHVEAARRLGKGAVFVAGHFGSWEVFAVALRNLGIDGTGAADRFESRAFADWLRTQRTTAGFSEIVDTGSGVYRTFRARIAAGKYVAMVSDLRVRNGIAVPFFGVDAVTNVIPARLAGSFGAPVIPTIVRRLRGARFEVEVYPALSYVDTGAREADERAFLAQLHAIFEAEIRRKPQHWHWIHRRWKQPA